jgi:hypothetical protein
MAGTVIYQLGQLNTAGALQPGVYTQIAQPPPVMAGVATNGYGLVGVASWGPVNSASVAGSPQQAQASCGLPVNRQRDLSTALAVAFGLGQYNNWCVRVTDGTDTAATASLLDTASTIGVTLAAYYTGSLGNQLVATPSAGTAAQTYKVVLSLPGSNPETFDNLSGGLAGAAVTPGTGYTSVPLVSVSAPTLANPVQATASATLQCVTNAVAVGGMGYAVNDTITLSNGVILKVTAVTAGVITTAGIQSAGSIASGSVPANPVQQASTSGAGTGAKFTLTWGLGPLTIGNVGNGYATANLTVTGGGGGTGGSYTPVVTIWPGLVSAINTGQSGVRGPSQLAVAVIGTSSASPALTSVTFSGGSDGAAGVTDASLIGSNASFPPTGMYALQSSNVQTLNLIDHQTTSQWSTIAQFCLSYGIFGAAQGMPGQNYATVGSALSTAGVDTYGLKCLIGDWVYWSDTVNNTTRLLAPATFWGPMRANLAPNQSTLNKPVLGIVGTQRSLALQPYTGAEILAAQNYRLDFLANPAPGGNYFAFQTDRNTASYTAQNSEAYTTMTNFLAITLASTYGYVIGKPQTTDLRSGIRDAITSFLTNLWLVQKYIGDVNNPTKQPFTVEMDANNNPSAQVAQGVMACLVKVKYQSIVRVFLITLQGGSTVTINVS